MVVLVLRTEYINNMRQPPRESYPASFLSKILFTDSSSGLFESNYVFLYASGRFGDATHDALGNAVSVFMQEVEEGLLEDYFWVVGDEGYPVSEYIIVTFPRLH